MIINVSHFKNLSVAGNIILNCKPFFFFENITNLSPINSIGLTSYPQFPKTNKEFDFNSVLPDISIYGNKEVLKSFKFEISNGTLYLQDKFKYPKKSHFSKIVIDCTYHTFTRTYSVVCGKPYLKI